MKQARELRDRYLEEVSERGLLPESWSEGKYDVSRALPESGFTTDPAEVTEDPKLLDAA